MKKLFKHKVLFLGFTIILTVNSLAGANKILPISKPKPDKEIVTQVKQKKYIYPQKKPIDKTEKIATEVVTIADDDKDLIAIYPQKNQ